MFSSLKVGFFLALRYLRRANKWSTGLTVFVMMLTFLNLVMVTGILVGLIVGSEREYTKQYSGDVFVSTYPENTYIQKSPFVISVIETLPGIKAFSPRYVVGGSVEAGYQRTAADSQAKGDRAGAEIAGVNIEKELALSHLDADMLEGKFIEEGDEDMVAMGANLFERYTPGEIGFATLGDVAIGDKVRVTIAGVAREMTLKGIFKTKAGPTDSRVYILDTELRKFLNRSDYGLNEIAIQLDPGVSPISIKNALLRAGVGDYALVRTGTESLGQFLEQIKSTFSLLGNIIGATSLAVASITIFIVVFVTAITRKKFIGILKGIGITGTAVEFSYILLALFYACVGIGIGTLLLVGVFIPYFNAHPINFPFSDGILAVSFGGTVIRIILIMITTIIAGYIPAKLIVRKDALSAMRGQ